jgi:hypothetical protein
MKKLRRSHLRLIFSTFHASQNPEMMKKKTQQPNRGNPQYPKVLSFRRQHQASLAAWTASCDIWPERSKGQVMNLVMKYSTDRPIEVG